MGFVEGNSVLMNLAGALGLNLLVVLASVKILFIFGSAWLVILGVRTTNKTTQRVVLAGVFAFALVFAFTCANNLYWILT
jgi:hypothetical protein